MEEQIYDINQQIMLGGNSGLDVQEMETDEEILEKKQILNLVFANDYKGLKDLHVT